jgi:triosephosphate isomerase (TIM)
MQKIVIGNLKMNILSPAERERYLDYFKKELEGKKLKNVELVICPPYVHLEKFKESRIKKMRLGGQNMFWADKGSFTGEISSLMLKNLGCEYVIIGHSERRRYFCEKDEEINLKLNSALKNYLKPILCVGETRVEKENNEILRVITRQIENAFKKISRSKIEDIIVAYEPVWAVGTDIVPTSNEIMEAKVLIKKTLANIFGVKYAEKVQIIYGGSVSSQTAYEVCVQPGMDGVLVGRESLTPHEFVKIASIIGKG